MPEPVTEHEVGADGAHVPGRENAREHREHVDPHQPQPERGNGQSDHGAEGEQMIEERVLAYRAHDAREEPQRHGHREGADHQHHGGRNAVEHDLAHRPPVPIRPPPVPREHSADPPRVLLRHRPVEPQLMGEPIQILRAHRRRVRIDRRRSPRSQMQHQEPNNRHQHEHDERLQDPANQIPMHARRLPRSEEDPAAQFTAPPSARKESSSPDHGAHAAPGGIEGGALPRPVSSGEILRSHKPPSRGGPETTQRVATQRGLGRAPPSVPPGDCRHTRNPCRHASYAFHPHSAIFQLLVSVLLFGL